MDNKCSMVRRRIYDLVPALLQNTIHFQMILFIKTEPASTENIQS